MKERLLALGLLLALTFSVAHAQLGVHPKDLRGTWQLVFNIGEQAESATERVVLNAVEGVLDEIDVRFEFLADNELKVTVNAFGEQETEYAEWEINDHKELILGETDHFEGEDTVWLFNEGRLHAYEYEHGEHLKPEKGFYLKRIKE